MLSISHVTLCNSMDGPPGSLSMGFPRQEYWSELPFSPSRDVPSPEIKPLSPAAPALKAGRFLNTEPPGKSNLDYRICFKLKYYSDYLIMYKTG